MGIKEKTILLLLLSNLAVSVITMSFTVIIVRYQNFEKNSKMFAKGYQECILDTKESDR